MKSTSKLVLEEPERQQVTFEEICPHWTRLLITGKKTKRWHLLHPDVCIVGEAWHRDPFYGGCMACNYFSTEFIDVVGYSDRRMDASFSISDPDAFNEVRLRFVKHWNKCHSR